MPAPRVRPTINITIRADLLERVDALVDKLPGANRSQITDELIEASLPLYETMAEALIGARDERGNVDESKAKDRAAQGIAAIVRKGLDQIGAGRSRGRSNDEA
jgi:hypothetical protein